jgi:hypothetical protein
MDLLEDIIDESIRWSVANGSVPTVFNRMRRHFGTVAAIKTQSDEIQSGFKTKDPGLIEWSIEVAPSDSRRALGSAPIFAFARRTMTFN